jgi:hypothetical protein
MKLYGHADEGLPVEKMIPAAMAEITLCASPDELRQMAEFFVFCAAEMERMGSTYDHVHLSDHMKQFRSSPHLVVAAFPKIGR